MSLVELKKVSFTNGSTQVINNVSLQIEPGTSTAFLGKPGGGKSTALKIAAGIIPITKGNVFFDGTDISKMTSKEDLAFRKRTGFMFQDSALWENQDIYNNLDIPLRIHFPKMAVEDRKILIEEQAALVGYEKSLSLRPAALSIGERKRIGLARALICKPELLFLDEPTESIDEKTAQLFSGLLQDFLSKNNTLIYVSHDITFINNFKADKYYFDKGEIVDRILLNNELLYDDDSFI